MPSGYLHQLCAEEACAQSGVTPASMEAMVLGAQGPDPLFTLGIFPLGRSSKPGPLGHLLHQRRTGAFLCALCRRAREGGGVARAYALGFLTHYALDSTVHPYVYAHSYREDGSYSSTMHVGLEKQWDGQFYRKRHASGTSVVMPGVTETKADWPQIAQVWQRAMQDVFPEENVTEDTMMQALLSTEKANRLTHSPSGIKYGLAWAGERLIGKPGLATSQMTPRFPQRQPLLNENNAPWRSPFAPEQERTESVPVLLEAAARRAAGLLKAAAAYFDGDLSAEALAEAIGNDGYDTGMESKP